MEIKKFAQEGHSKIKSKRGFITGGAVSIGVDCHTRSVKFNEPDTEFAVCERPTFFLE